MLHVLYLGPPDALPTVREILEPKSRVVAPELGSVDIKEYLKEAVAILDASMKFTFDRAMLDGAPQLRVIATATTGADHIDSQILAERAVPLFTLAGEKALLRNLTPAAEHSWTLLMACCRHIRGATHHVLEGKWVREEFPGILLKGKRLGLIGCGRIGSWMARYGLAFGVEVIGYDPFVKPWPEQIRRSGFDELLSTVDFVSVHVPLNAETRGMIGAREFGLMKRGAVFINTSRGAITDEQALLQSLVDGRLAAAGIDVLDGEPEIDHHPLVEYARRHENLLITPHIGGFSPDAVRLVVAHAARRILAALDHNKIAVTRETG